MIDPPPGTLPCGSKDAIFSIRQLNANLLVTSAVALYHAEEAKPNTRMLR